MTTEHEDTPVRIACFGMDEYAKRMVDTIFRQRAHSRFVLSDEFRAEAGMVDLDGFGAQARWKQYRVRHPELPTLVLSIRAQNLPNTRFIQKPVDVGELLTGLDYLHDQVRDKTPPPTPSPTAEMVPAMPGFVERREPAQEIAKPKLVYHDAGFDEENGCGEHKTYHPDKPLGNEEIHYHPEQYLQRILRRAMDAAESRDTNIRLEGLKENLIVSPTNHRVYYTTTQQQIRAMAMLPHSADKLRQVEMPHKELDALFQATTTPIRYQYTDRLLWKLAIWGANGRLPADTPLDRPVVIKYWPNFTRLLLTPHAQRIVALWRKTPVSLMETAHRLRIHPCYVFTVFSAAHALDIALIERRLTERAPPERKTDHSAKRGLFQRILARLRLPGDGS